jgi:hypothetical protein
MRMVARLVRVAGEGGVDDDAFAVADDEQRRVVELQGVVGELLQGGVEVAARLLVLPAEVAALPDVGPAVPSASLPGAALEAVVVGVARLVDAEQVAKVVKMSLRAGAFGDEAGVVLSDARDWGTAMNCFLGPGICLSHGGAG